MENKRKQKDKREAVYIAAVSLYDSKEYYKALNEFNTISDYKDSDDYINKCQYCLNEESYERGKTEFDNARYYNAYLYFSEIKDHRDASYYLGNIEGRYADACTLLDKKKYHEALQAFKDLTHYKDSDVKYRDCYAQIEKKRKKRRLVLTIATIVLLIVAALVLNYTVLIPTHKAKVRQSAYKSGVNAINSGNYSDCISELKNLSYKDSDKIVGIAEGCLAYQDGNIDEGNKKITAVGGKINITYDPNGGAIDPIKETMSSYHEINDKKSEKDFYNFVEWEIVDFKAQIDTDSYQCSLDLKAVYNTTKYTISYALDGGFNNNNNPTEYTVESDTILLSDPEKEGYKFMGWTMNGQKTAEIPHGSNGNIVLTATWSKKYYINYNLEGGTNSKNNPEVFAVEDVINIEEPTRKGYEFVGWNDGMTTTKDYVVNHREETITLTAIWSIITYSINYTLNEGIQNDSNPTTYTVESDTIVLKEPTKRGYSFLGWFDENNQRINSIPAGSTGNTKLTAKWSINTYKVTLHHGDGVIDNEVLNVEYNSYLNLSNAQRKGYKFLGWFDNNNSQWSSGKFDYIDNLDLYARWEAKTYTIYLDPNGGKLDENYIQVIYDAYITLPTPQRDYINFNGWYYGDQKLSNSLKWNIDGNVTLKAEWNNPALACLQYNRTGSSIGISGINNYNYSYLVIPETIDGYPVYSISGSSYSGSTVTYDHSAFKNLTQLKYVEIASTVHTIGQGAFMGCSNIETMVLPFVGEMNFSSLTESFGEYYLFGYIFGPKSFSGAEETKQFYSYNGTYNKDTYTYNYIPTSIKNVTITSKMTTLGVGAFSNCSHLETIKLPSSITKTGDRAFYNCPAAVTYY